MHEALTPARMEIILVLAGQDALSVEEVARRVGRDVQQDIARLINAGVIERDEDGGVKFEFDGLRFDFEVGPAD